MDPILPVQAKYVSFHVRIIYFVYIAKQPVVLFIAQFLITALDPLFPRLT